MLLFCAVIPEFFVCWKKLFIRTPLSLLLSQATLFLPPPPIRTTLNLLFAKNVAVLFILALILCCKAWTSHRFKSLPAILGKFQFSAKPVTWWTPVTFAKTPCRPAIWIVPRSPEVRKPLVCFLRYFLHNAKRINPSPFRELSRFSKPRISAQR